MLQRAVYAAVAVALIFLVAGKTYHLTNLKFICVGYVDFTRKLFMLKVLRDIISPRPDPDFKFTRHFPALFLSCSKTLDVWVSFREVVMDLGKKYTKRIEVYISVFIISYLTIGIFVFLIRF